MTAYREPGHVCPEPERFVVLRADWRYVVAAVVVCLIVLVMCSARTLPTTAPCIDYVQTNYVMRAQCEHPDQKLDRLSDIGPGTTFSCTCGLSVKAKALENENLELRIRAMSTIPIHLGDAK